MGYLFTGGMQLRSGAAGRRSIEQDATSRVHVATPIKGQTSKRCIYVDDEAQENGSNSDGNSEDETLMTKSIGAHETAEKHESQSTLGKHISLGLIGQVLSSFYDKRKMEPPLVPLCRLVSNEAIRKSSADITWLVSSFDNATYMESMGSFTVSLCGQFGQRMPITPQDLENWGPLWRQVNDAFEADLPPEWEDLKGVKFLIWDGNHRYKTWMKRVKDGEF